ncbi:ABC transporter ATP-binding protein [Clostridium sp. KNHs205]|uniref:ABC transporter ATP-binding protein n=1 Tax=Clostridium sp. KNHs205 TaxID=1449050 RepID=UPI00051AEA7C|nr:ABC transporter ATP-binding protein [Clostridium sp. KNHs205]
MNKNIELKFFFRKLKGYYKLIIPISFTILITAILGLYVPLLNKNILDKGILLKDFNYIKRTILLFIIVYFIKCLMEVLNSYLIARLNTDLRVQLFKDSFQHLVKLPLSYFEKNEVTKIYNNISTDINTISKISDGSLFSVLSQIIYFIGGIICLFNISSTLAIIGLLSIPLKYIMIGYFSGKNKKLTKEYLIINSQFANWLQDSIAGIREVKLYNLFENKNKELTSIKTISAKYEKMFSLISTLKDQVDLFNTQVVVMLVYLVGTYILISGEITYGEILAFLTYLVYVTSPVTSFSNLKFIFASITPSAKRLYDLLHTSTEEDTEKDKTLSIDDVFKLEFQKVSYSINEKVILKDISFNLSSGDRIAIVGDNGSGKSTLINLIARFINPSTGEILINGKNVKEYNINSYRDNISIADSKSYMFDYSIYNNINICNQLETINVEELDIAIAKSEFDNNLIDETKNLSIRNSKNLSSGEKQKIIIARSLSNERSIMIFDEATSNIDLKSRKKIESVIANEFEQSITIFVTHNLDSLTNFNKILFIKDSSLYKIGAYEDLIDDKYFQELFAKERS